MIRRIVRWLARHEIAEAYLLGCHARGELHGQEQAFLAVEQEVGLNRRVESEDVAKARKRSVN